MDRNSQEFQDYLWVKAQLLNHFADQETESRSVMPVARVKISEPCRKNTPVEKATKMLPQAPC